MSKEELAGALRELAKSEQNRNDTARLKEVLEDVEAALEAGVSRATILATLHQRGFKFTDKGFESALFRLRKQKKKLRESSSTPVTEESGENQNTDYESNDIVRPSGISDSEWSDMQVEFNRTKRKRMREK